MNYSDKDGNVKYRDASLENKFHIVDENYTLAVTNVQSADSGNYSCEKSFKKFVNGDLNFFEETKSRELIVQGRFSRKNLFSTSV